LNGVADSNGDGISLLRPVGESVLSSKRKKAKKLSKEKLAEQQREAMNRFRREQKIHANGTDIPDPCATFDEMMSRFHLSKTLQRNVLACGYETPTPIQMQAMPALLRRRELLACAPTGSGKTLAFILPILHHLEAPRRDGFRAVIISPTRELAQQIYREFCRLNEGVNLRVHALTKAKASGGAFTGGASGSQRYDVLISTPNRLVHMLSMEPPAVRLDRVEWLVFDEGDKLFEAGDSGFREQVAAIFQACTHADVRRCLFSATFANSVEEWAREHLDAPLVVTVGGRNTATDTVEQELMFVGAEAGKLLALRQIVQKGFAPPVLVFVQSKDRARELFNELIYDGINVDVIHAERTQAQRDNVVKAFRAGKIWVLIATELMGRGIDFRGVNLVINYDFPTTAVSYIHRIGRTGRAGLPGRAVTMFTEDDVVYLRSIANVMKASGCEVPDWMLKLKKNSRRREKNSTAARPVARVPIRTVSKFDLQRSHKKKQIVADTKVKKMKMSADGES